MYKYAQLLVFFILLGGVSGSFAAENTAALSAFNVTLYPDSGDVEEWRDVTLQKGVASLVLPVGADVSSLRVVVASRQGQEVRQVLGTQLRHVAAHVPPRVAALRKEVEAARSALRELEGRAEAVKMQKKMWADPPLRASTTAELLKVEETSGKRLMELNAESVAIAGKLETASKALQRLENDLARLGGNAMSTTQADVTVSGKPEGVVRCTLRYRLYNCGWKPLTRVTALPARNAVVATQLAVITQQTGVDWENATVTISTTRPSTSLTPPTMSAWFIGPQQSVVTRSMMLAAPQQTEAALNDAATASAPVFTEGAAYGSWALGKRRLPAGEDVVLTLEDVAFDASFVRLVRPSVAETAYLMASLTSPSARSMPSSAAEFFVDDLHVGTGEFAFNGVKDTAYFGEDPAVRVLMKLNSRQSGTQGLIGTQGTLAWDWVMDITNAHTMPVTVRVEDPAPQARDERVTLKLASTPMPETVDNQCVWQLDVPAGEKSVIHHVVRASAPEELKVFSGR